MSRQTIIIAILIVILCFLMGNNQKLKESNAFLESNIEALNDSVRTYKTSTGVSVAVKKNYTASKKDVSKALESSIGKTKEVSTPITVTQIETRMVHDTIYMQSLDSTYLYNDEWLAMEAELTDSTLNINQLETLVPLTISITKSNETLVASSNPYVRISSIDTYIQRQKTKRWHVGVSAGVGGIYGLNSKQFDVGPGVLVGVSYSIK